MVNTVEQDERTQPELGSRSQTKQLNRTQGMIHAHRTERSDTGYIRSWERCRVSISVCMSERRGNDVNNGMETWYGPKWHITKGLREPHIYVITTGCGTQQPFREYRECSMIARY